MLADARAELELPGRRVPVRAFLDVVSKPVSARVAVAALIGLAAVSIAVRAIFAFQVRAPFFFMDELGYERMATSFARHGTIALFGKVGLAYSPLYPIVIAPVYVATSSAQTAYEAVKVVNAVLMSLSAFPVYGIARFVLTRRRAIGVAALSLVAPLMFYSGLELSESLAYPLFLVAVWTMLRALSSPSAKNDALLLAAIALASAARLQQVALVPAGLTAVVAFAVARPGSGKQRVHAAARAVVRHRLLFGATTAVILGGAARTIANGGSLPLAGRYAAIGHARANPLRVLEVAAQHVAELDFALGIIPFAGALVAAYALVKLRFPRQATMFAAVALSTSVWLILEVAFDAAVYDNAHVAAALPRIHERYLVYLVPLFLVALVAALRATRERVGSGAHLAVAAAAAALPAAIPFAGVVNYTIPVESFGLQIFGTNRHGTIAAVPQAPLIAFCVGAVLMLGYLYALLRPRPSFAIVLTVIVFLMLSSLVRLRLIGQAQTTYEAVRTHAAWVDGAAKGDVVLVAGRPATRHPLRDRAVLLDTAFRNLRISRLYYTCKPVFGADFGEQRLTEDVHASYVVAPASLGVRGRVVARQSKEGLVLVAPAAGVVHPRPCS